MSDKSIVSIIVRTKGRPKLLRQALRSISAQTYRPIEVVLVNHGGCPLKRDPLKELLTDVSFHFINLRKNTGRAHAGNVGIENATGKYIGFLDDDAMFYPEHLSILTGFLESMDFKVVYSDAVMVHKSNNQKTGNLETIKKELLYSEDFDESKLLFENYIPFMSLLFDREVLKASGGFDGTFDLFEDWDLLNRISESSPFYHVKRVTAQYIQWSDVLQISKKKKDHVLLEQSYLKILKKHFSKFNEKRIYRYVGQNMLARMALNESRQKVEHLVQENQTKTEIISHFESDVRQKEALRLQKDLRLADKDRESKDKERLFTGLENLLIEKTHRHDSLETELKNTRQQTVTFEAKIKDQERTIADLENKLNWKNQETNSLKNKIEEMNHRITNLKELALNFESHSKTVVDILRNIYESPGWHTYKQYFRIRDRLFPLYTRRWLLARMLSRTISKPAEAPRIFNVDNLRRVIFNISAEESISPDILADMNRILSTKELLAEVRIEETQPGQEQKNIGQQEKPEEKIIERSSINYGNLPIPSEKNDGERVEENNEEKVKKVLETRAAVKLKLFLSDPDSRLAFPLYEAPLVTIILVTFNSAWHTYNCLESIKAHADLPYEIVLVDNDSRDETTALLDRLNNVKVIRNRVNYGFVLACNQAGAASRGKYLVFLNNDTEVLPNWLSHLVQTFENNDQCGAVGTRLIKPDGRLQEAGGIIWKDGSTVGYGRYDDPFKADYSFFREVDYCSGACLLVSAELFKDLGGFDEQYALGYYEETDFCMKLRQKGYKVIYTPFASIIHYEFGSSSYDDAVESMRKNQGKFVKKWRSILTGYYQRKEGNILFARTRTYHQKILVIDDRIPALHLGCGYPRMYRILETLVNLGYDVTFFPLLDSAPYEPYKKNLQQAGIEVCFNNDQHKLDLPDFIAKRAFYYDAVLISRPHNAREAIGLVRNGFPKIPILYDAEALFSQREIIRCRLNKIPHSEVEKNQLIQDEINLINLADVVLTVSNKEEEIMRTYGVKKETRIWGNSMTERATQDTLSEREAILLVGSFLDPQCPNEDAAIYFVKEIFPLILKRLKTRLFIVGTNHLESIKELASPSITITGRVDNLEKFYARCRVFIVPTRFAAGIPCKLQEAMSYGLPAVVTPLIANQLELTNGMEVLVGKDPYGFSDHVVSLYEDAVLWKKIQKGGLKYIREACSPEKFKQAIQETMKECLS